MQELDELECLFEVCDNCPAWTGTTCSGELEVNDGTAEIQRPIPNGND